LVISLLSEKIKSYESQLIKKLNQANLKPFYKKDR